LGRERVIGDLRRGPRQPAQERRFAGVGQTDQAHVGDHLQLQDDPALLAGGAGLELAGGAVSRGGEGLVAATAATAAGHVDFVAVAAVGAAARDVLLAAEAHHAPAAVAAFDVQGDTVNEHRRSLDSIKPQTHAVSIANGPEVIIGRTHSGSANTSSASRTWS